MCVILFAETKYPSEQMVDKMFNHNKDGAGIAYREDKDILDVHGAVVGSQVVVRWKKGLDLQGLKDELFAAPLPFIAHCRIASVGGVKKELTHPFLINDAAGIELEGETDGYVHFHNGHWGKWKNVLLETLPKIGKKLPTGPWSDTRAMAFLMNHYGLGFMDLLEEKGIAMSPTDIEVFAGTGWKKVEEMWVSNDFFLNSMRGNHSTYYYPGNGQAQDGQWQGQYCRNTTCTSKDIDMAGYCPKHRVAKVDAVKVEKGGSQGGVDIKTAVEVAIDVIADEKGLGGSPDENPFMVLERMWKAKEVSTNQFKKIRRVLAQGEKTKDLVPKNVVPIGMRLPS